MESSSPSQSLSYVQLTASQSVSQS